MQVLLTSADGAGGPRVAATRKEIKATTGWVGGRHSRPENSVEGNSVNPCRESCPGAQPQFFTGGGIMLELYVVCLIKSVSKNHIII